MKTELTDVSPTRKEIRIEIEPSQVRDAYDKISDEFTKNAKIPGFRPGHAPRSVVRTRYKNEIRTEVLRELVPEAVNNAIIEHSLDAISEPEVHFEDEETLERLGEQPITVKVGVEVVPEIKLGEYKGLEAVRKTRPITDEDVDKAIQSLREASAVMVPVEDRPSELGDTVVVNARGRLVDEPDEEEIKVDEIEVVIGGPNVQKEFTENLTGVRPDETKTFIVDYPDDFSTPTLAGKKLEYVTEVTAVRRREVPEFDEEWAKSLGEEVDSVDTLKKKVREDLEMRAQAEAGDRLRADLIRKIVAAHQFEVPESWIEKQTNQRFESVLRDMMAHGIDPRTQQVDWEGARAQVRDQAVEDVRATMLLDRIAQAENIDVTNEEVEAEIALMSQMARQPIEQLRAALTKHGGERSIAQRLRNRKALDLLIENARITDADWNESKKADEAESNEASAAATNE